MLFHLIFLATVVLGVLANEAHIAALSYSPHNDWGCSTADADAIIYQPGDTRFLYQNFYSMPIAWPSVVPTTTYTCTVQYNITLDEPGRVILNNKSAELMGAVQTDSFATVAVLVAYRWIEPGITASNKFLVPGPITGQFVSTLNTSKPVVSGCGGGVLEVMVRSQITSSLSKPAYYIVDDPVPGERTWRVLTSLDIEEC